MASALGEIITAVGLVALLGLHTVVAAVAARFFRIRLATRWAAVLYTVILVPVVYVPTATVGLGLLSLGGAAATTVGRGTMLVFLWGVPLALGVSIDVFWMPPPEAFDLPEQTNRQQ